MGEEKAYTISSRETLTRAEHRGILEVEAEAGVPQVGAAGEGRLIPQTLHIVQEDASGSWAKE